MNSGRRECKRAMHKSAHAQVNASQRTKIQTPLGAQVNLPRQSVNPRETGGETNGQARLLNAEALG